MQNLTMNTKLLKWDIYIKSLKLSPWGINEFSLYAQNPSLFVGLFTHSHVLNSFMASFKKMSVERTCTTLIHKLADLAVWFTTLPHTLNIIILPFNFGPNQIGVFLTNIRQEWFTSYYAGLVARFMLEAQSHLLESVSTTTRVAWIDIARGREE